MDVLRSFAPANLPPVDFNALSRNSSAPCKYSLTYFMFSFCGAAVRVALACTLSHTCLSSRRCALACGQRGSCKPFSQPQTMHRFFAAALTANPNGELPTDFAALRDSCFANCSKSTFSAAFIFDLSFLVLFAYRLSGFRMIWHR